MRERLTYANVMSTLAVFLALGLGGAYAADKITSKDLAKGSVKSKAIKDRTIVGKDVADGKLTGADLADGSVAAADLAPLEIVNPQLGNGGQNDCLWLDAAAAEPNLTPVSYRRDGFGQVSLSGIVEADDGPGGDGTCNGGPPDGSEDSRIFVLEAGDQPAKSGVHLQPGGTTGVFVVGSSGLVSGPTQYPPGAVLGAVSAVISLDGISFVAAGPSATGAPDRISPAKLRRLIG